MRKKRLKQNKNIVGNRNRRRLRKRRESLEKIAYTKAVMEANQYYANAYGPYGYKTIIKYIIKNQY